MSPDSVREERLISLMDQYEVKLKRMCCVYLRDMSLAEDAVQETFVKAYKCLDSFRGESNEKTWLMRIAINTCKDMRRASWFRYVDRHVTLESIPAPICDSTFEQAELVMDIMKLPRKYLVVVLLHYYQGMTTREIAQVLKIPHQTVSSRLKHAREKLRAALEGGQCNE
jgi:RNA polymerase sigma-70 factor (ECF subfamily)